VDEQLLGRPHAVALAPQEDLERVDGRAVVVAVVLERRIDGLSAVSAQLLEREPCTRRAAQSKRSVAPTAAA
jgi:hypothetical protein